MIRFRIIFLVMGVLTLLFILAAFLLGLISAIITYHGMCFGFTDGSWDCSWQQYASDQVFWSSLLLIPLGMYIFVAWLVALGLWLYKRRTLGTDGLPLSQVFLIPISGYFLGFSLISVLPIIIRVIYSHFP
jgi:phosphotransferase system  glucose/maltose/N-acetylglucosamine-specific IIC component